MNKIGDIFNSIKKKMRRAPSLKPQYENADKEETKAEEYSNKIKDFLNNFKPHKSPVGKPGIFSRIKPKYILIIFLIICAILIVASSYTPKIFKPFNAIASVLIVPAQNGVNSIGAWFSDKIELTKKIEDLSNENKDLKKEIENLRGSNSMLRNQSAELLRLQDIIKLQEQYLEYDTVGASVISKDSSKWFSIFTVNKGTKDGIRKDMNVLAGDGLCGIVIDVGYNYATVRSIIDDDSAVSAQFQDKTDLCIVHGKLTLAEQNLLEFSNVDLSVEIDKDQPVVTSRVSSKFLPGLLIGYVSEYITDANELTKSGYLTPVVDFSNINEVLIITKLKSDFIDTNTEPDEEAPTEKVTEVLPEEDMIDETVIPQGAIPEPENIDNENEFAPLPEEYLEPEIMGEE